MTDGPLFTGWLRIPPSRSWRLVATGPDAEVRRVLDAAAQRHRLVDTMVLPAGEVPDAGRRDGRCPPPKRA